MFRSRKYRLSRINSLSRNIMFKNSESLNPKINDDLKSEGDSNEFSNDETDEEENVSKSHLNNSMINENEGDSVHTSLSTAVSLSHLEDGPPDTNNWSPSFPVEKGWNYQSVLNDETQTRLKINLSKVKKVKIKKPRVNNTRIKNELFSLFHTNVLKKRNKNIQSNSSKRRSVPKSRAKISPPIPNSVNGLNVENVNALNSKTFMNKIPEGSASSVTAKILEENDNSVGEYAQFLELKPSVKFKCYRCGIKDFSTITLLQEHISSCNGKIDDPVTHPSPVRTIKPSTSSPSASPNLRITRKVFLCSSCGTYYQNYNLYIHMRDKHNKQICLFCRNIFARSDLLWNHLVTTHKLNSVTYSNASQIRTAFRSSFYITCCSCNSIFSDDDPFNEHVCGGNDNLKAADRSFCVDCKPRCDSNQILENNMPSKTVDKISVFHRRESTSGTEEDLESFTEFQDRFMSRGSTLDFIGVPEQHTVTSFPDEIMHEKEPQFEDKDNEVLDKTLAPIDEQANVLDNNNDDATPMNVNSYQEDMLSTCNDENESAHDSVPIDSRELASNSELMNESSVNESKVAESDHSSEHEHSLNDDDAIKDHFACKADEITEAVPDSNLNKTNESDASLEIPDSQCPDSQDFGSNVDASEEIKPIPPPLIMALMLDETVDSLDVQSLIKECVRTSCLTCLYCSNATVIAVNGHQLVAHLLAEHRFMPTKNEDDSQTVIQKLESGMVDLKTIYMNASFSSHQGITFDGSFSCLQCSFSTQLFKDLCHHKRRAHHKVIFLCIMCKCSFQFYSQLLCHLCPGFYSSERQHSLTYHCCFCNVDLIPSAFRLMVHLRKIHQACDICLSRHTDQSELYSHMIKQHKINHLCYKCNLAWRSRDDINKHLFWKHGTESVLCKRCLQKKWPHAYHFCIPASTYTCDECSRTFTKAVALTVHRRVHNNEFPFSCDLCEQRCISKKLLAIHRESAHNIMREPRVNPTEDEIINGDKESSQIDNQIIEKNSDNDDGRGRRKKKRKKAKNVSEKPLLDELPPLNLSSESEEDSGDEENAKSESTLTVQAQTADDCVEKITDDIVETPLVNELDDVSTNVAVAVADSANVDKTPEKDDEEALEGSVIDATANSELLEKILNCLIIEHSYCIPESIFHSEVTNHSAVSESSDNANKQQSPKPCSKRDKSCCKSIAPRKRKHVPKKESSSSDSSSDTDSSSSSCGSNCSCNKSASNCSSSSSSESTTPEKRTNGKKTLRSPSKEKSIAEENSIREQSLLSVPETELDTDITTSDEDFYEKHPFIIPPVESKTESLIGASTLFEKKVTTSLVSPNRNERKNKKRRKKPKITINLGGIHRSSTSLSDTSYTQSLVATIPSSVDRQVISSTFIPHPHSNISNSTAPIYQAPCNTMHLNCVSSPITPTTAVATSSGIDSSGRISKRKRVKNKFYGYSSSEEMSGNETLKTIIHIPKKRPPPKKLTKSRSSFIGIRAKKSLNIIPPKRYPNLSSITNSLASDMHRPPAPVNDVYRQRNFLKPVVPESSDDSDSDEKRHTLVINLPNLKEETYSNLNYRSSTASSYSNNGDSLRTSSWFSQRNPSNAALSSFGQPAPNKKELYCFCRCPYDEVSEMIGCDGPNCAIEWFHFECVGIMSAPQGQWFCPNCRKDPENISLSF